uniref:Uncharacterized protein n=1 Tax=Arundo donax TaxID=35708 RepID=A0A0A9DUX0_ARUDO
MPCAAAPPPTVPQPPNRPPVHHYLSSLPQIHSTSNSSCRAGPRSATPKLSTSIKLCTGPRSATLKTPAVRVTCCLAASLINELCTTELLRVSGPPTTPASCALLSCNTPAPPISCAPSPSISAPLP